LALLTFFFGSAHAANQCTFYGNSSTGGVTAATQWSTDKASACASGVAYANSLSPGYGWSLHTCDTTYPGQYEAYGAFPGLYLRHWIITKTEECVDMCGDKAGKPAESDGCAAGTCGVSWTGDTKWPGGAAGVMCVNGCTAVGNVTTTGKLSDGASTTYAIVKGTVYTGRTCSAGTPTSTVSATTQTREANCEGTACEQPDGYKYEPGKCPGEINGVTVWVRCGVESTTVTGTGTDVKGTTSTPGGTVSVPTSSTSTTTCNATTCTTTTETKTEGGTTTTKVTAEPVSDKCKDPAAAATLAVCKSTSPSAFSGACSSGFTCTGGDAAICAAARGVWESRCALESVQTDANNSTVRAGLDAMTGTDPANHPRSQKTTVSVGTLNQSNPFGGGQCPADHNITFLGQSIAVPLSSACSVFQLMGSLAVGLSLLVAAFIVAKGI
jgi:hypothetical protein